MNTAKTIDEAYRWYMQDGRRTYAVSAVLIAGSIVFQVEHFPDWEDLRLFLISTMEMNKVVTLEKRPDYAFEGYSRLDVRW